MPVGASLNLGRGNFMRLFRLFTAAAARRALVASTLLLAPAGAQGSVDGDTVSPIEISLTAYCGKGRIDIAYRNSWIDGTGPIGIHSLTIDGKAVADGASAINARIGRVRISGISFLKCHAARGEFLLVVVVDGGDAARLEMKDRNFFFAVDRASIRPL